MPDDTKLESIENFNDPQTWLKPIIDQDIADIVSASRAVYNELGTGHTEAAYESALEIELFSKNFLNIRRQVPCPIIYKGFVVGMGYIDLLINDKYIIELKTVAKLTNKDEAQTRKYLKEGQYGILINLNPSSGVLEVVKIFE